ncbi:MAG: acyltransferase [Bacillota bacterium]
MNRIATLDYIRAVAMCGVLMIHTGSYALGNSTINPAFIALFEILTRFSIPIFFFVSAFGLFINHNPDKPFSYWKFLQKRGKSVFVPYVVWSVIYLLIARDYSGLQIENFSYKLLFGLGSYQLYFLVLLLWFYILMPLWRLVVPFFARRPLVSLIFLFVAQLLFNNFSVHYLWNVKTNIPFVDALISYRVSYWVAHYFFIFILGGICALKQQQFVEFCSKRFLLICAAFACAAINIVGQYYYYLDYQAYSLLDCINTFHQLSVPGLIYTVAATIFLFALLGKISNPAIGAWLKFFADASYPVYLVHPLFMYLTFYVFQQTQLQFTVVNSTLFFLIVLTLSLIFSWCLDSVSKKIPLLGVLLKGG